ncbi:hypothetical protein EZV62_010774 [Acer yangbiense]|uniref:Myb/SANT-like domain-containing protein n=1 Tax=Acer yangbiense TaxID=1000413 RepID=A0A5C7I3I3_9ROSI|nr:hypothetical protein EZV62_010774 [Acer yangbiense]
MWKADCGFKNGYLAQLETMMEAKLPNCGLKASPHIESRVKTLKAKYCALHELLSQSGFGWNDEHMMLMCEKNVYDEWVKIYGNDRATGVNASNAADDEEELQQDDTTDHENVESFIDLLNGNIGGQNMEFQSQGTEDFEISSSQPPSAQRRKSTDNNIAISKRAHTVRNKATNEMHKDFSNMASAIAAMAPKLDGLINVLSYEKEVVDLQAKLKNELNNMEGLRKNSWPELVGANGEAAAATIENENSNVNAIVVVDGVPVIMDFRCTRVWVWVNRAGNVVRVPRIG